MLKRGFYLLSNALGVHWRINRALVAWLSLAALVGIVIAITVVFNPKFSPLLISNNLLDTNLPRVIRPSIGLGTIILSRLFAFALLFALILLVCLNKWTVWFVFILAGYKGFEIFINLYWAITKFGIATGMVLFIVYLVLLLVLLVLTFCAIIFCLRTCAPVRQMGFRGGVQWKKFGIATMRFAIVLTAFAFVEWLLYWLILSKFVFVV